MLNEATTKYIKKLVDPALMTWKEFYMQFNKRDESHPSSAYRTTYEDNKNSSYTQKSKFPILINRFVVKGMEFELREQHFEEKYVMTDENGVRIEDENGSILYFNNDELKILGINPVSITVGIFDEDAVLVGAAQDEWGAVLITVVEEFRGFSLGEMLLKQFRKHYPKMDSGGFTEKGYNLTKKYYENSVRDYLSKGFYSYLIKNNHITKEKVKEIISQLPQRTISNKPNQDFNMRKGEILVHNFKDSSSFTVYNKKIFEGLDGEKGMNDFFINRAILGHFHLIYLDWKDAYRLYSFYTNPKDISKILNLLLASRLYDEKTPLIVDDVHKMFDKHIDKSLYEIKNGLAYSKGKPINYENLANKERQERFLAAGKDRLKAEEYEISILELAESLSETD
jgi:hypothetical protein